MKAVKAYIRCIKAEEVLEALEDAGIMDVTLIDVMGTGHLADPNMSKYSVKCVKKYSEVAKLEVVCSSAEVHKAVEAIRKAAFTGMPGDGMIFVSPVEMTVKIRTGVVGESEV